MKDFNKSPSSPNKAGANIQTNIDYSKLSLEDKFRSLYERGYYLFPTNSIINGKCSCGKSNCDSPGKHPLTANGLKDATRNLSLINTWIYQYPNANIAIRTGRDYDFFVLDIDVKNNGLEHLRWLEKNHSPLPATYTVLTGSGGLHKYFQYPKDIRITNKRNVKISNDIKKSGIDIRGDGGYVIAPGSKHESGQYYTILNDISFAEAPDWLIELITTKKKDFQELDKIDGEDTEVIFEGERNSSLFDCSLALRKLGYGAGVIGPALRAINNKSCETPVNPGEVERIINSSLNYFQNDLISKDIKSDFNLIAEKLTLDHDFITNKDSNTYKYDSKCWKLFTKPQLRNLALKHDDKRKSNSKKRNEIVSFIQDSTILEPIPWRDIKDYQIPMNNGVFDLKTRELLPLKKEMYLEAVLPYNRNLEAKAPLWNWFLEECLGDDPIKKEALQLFAGYALMPHAKYKKAIFLYGERDTGKSVVAQVFERMVGEHNISSVPLDKLDSPRDRAPIKGKMLNIVTEIAEQGKIAESGFKQLVSTGDPVEFDQKYAQPETCIPSCKFLVCSNKLPIVTDSSGATFIRILIIEFINQVPEAKQDRELVTKLSQEIEGIINWALEGALKLYENGGYFIEPQSSKEIMQAYKRDHNIVAKWAEKNLIKQEGGFTLFKDLWQDFQWWYKDQKIDNKLNDNQFGKLLKEAGYKTSNDRLGTGDVKTKLHGYILKSSLV